MFTAVTGTIKDFPRTMASALAEYRYQVFVRELGWPLQCPEGQEWDEFDRPDTLYVLACDKQQNIFGCARLIPTHRPYLLAEVFPHLVGDAPLPYQQDIWELSRFAMSSPKGQYLSAEQAWQNTVAMVGKVIDVARAQGARRLIAFTAMGNERLLRRMGVTTRRIARPQMIDDKPVLAFWIEIDDQTTRALQLAA